jgi:hypothetical protein
VNFSLESAPNAAQKYPNDYRAVSGDRTFSSSNPHWKSLGIKLAEIIVVPYPSVQQLSFN